MTECHSLEFAYNRTIWNIIQRKGTSTPSSLLRYECSQLVFPVCPWALSWSSEESLICQSLGGWVGKTLWQWRRWHVLPVPVLPAWGPADGVPVSSLDSRWPETACNRTWSLCTLVYWKLPSSQMLTSVRSVRKEENVRWWLKRDCSAPSNSLGWRDIFLAWEEAEKTSFLLSSMSEEDELEQELALRNLPGLEDNSSFHVSLLLLIILNWDQQGWH